MNRYVRTPDSISYATISKKDYSLSASQHMELVMKNKNFVTLKKFLSRNLSRKDLGIEVGTGNYIGYSTHFFIRTKALQSHSFLPDINSETALPMMPSEFINMDLKEGDVIISKDSNIGEIIILDKDYPNFMLSGALYRLPVIPELKYYLLAFVKHDVFREQLNYIVPRGATIRHAKTLFLDCKIPMPNKNSENTIEYISSLTNAIIKKQKLIKQKHELILQIIENELIENQKNNKFIYGYPSISDINEIGRLDTNLYIDDFKKTEFLLKNYVNGFQNIYDFGFTLSRGQNLQITNIGNSVYSKAHYSNFYTLMLPKHLSKYGTIDTVEYLGNPKKLRTLKKGDLIFGAEGFEKGRSIVIIEEKENTITNIHGITLKQKVSNIIEAIYIKCCLDYLRHKKLIDLYAVGGNGGSLAQKYWDVIPFPIFPIERQKEIATLYHNPSANYDLSSLTLDNFLNKDSEYNEQAGIYELDKTARILKLKLEQAIDNIVNDREVIIDFNSI